MSSLPSLQCCRGPQKSSQPFQIGICPKPLLPWLKYRPEHCWLYSENSKQKKVLKNHNVHESKQVVRSLVLTGLMSLRKPLGTSEGSSGFLCMNLWKWWPIFSESPFHIQERSRMPLWHFICDLQCFIKAHFTHQRLADPVDEGLWFLCSLRATAAHLQFHHFSLSVL